MSVAEILVYGLKESKILFILHCSANSYILVPATFLVLSYSGEMTLRKPQTACAQIV